MIPEDISDITLLQYQKFHQLNNREGLSKHEFNKRAISIFIEIPYHSLPRISFNDYETLVNGVVKALETGAPFKNRFTLYDLEYGFIPNFDEITQGEWVDLLEYQEDIKDHHKLMAILFREVEKKDKFGNYSIKPYEGTANRSEIFKEMPMNVVLGALGFFLTLSKELKISIQKSTRQAQMKDQKHWTTS
jgi:hypothetical protein